MGSNYPDALADFMETAARPLENAHETAPGTRIYNREYFVTPRAQTHPGDVSFGDFQGLEQAEEQESFENFNQKVYYRIKWSDYPPFSAAKHVKKTRNGNVRCITRREIVVQVAEVTQAFIQKYSRYNTQDDTWRVGPSFIELQDLILIALDKVSNGSVQPVYKLARV
ncbi:hypothetical protein EW026_g3916 [Hermanssonia centrifuga]|uniref:Uncharacterized protein n=1 Tax=Hermanssonia centrifuga TaxID=98765 RepID=A0A4S4KJU3_9APHY|nr:hypothetical protein EW026_g3916 [Hermanssonia centrifuga]